MKEARGEPSTSQALIRRKIFTKWYFYTTVLLIGVFLLLFITSDGVFKQKRMTKLTSFTPH